MANKLGYQCKLYRSSLTTWAGGMPGSLLEVKNCRDLTLPPERDTVEATTRGNLGWKSYLPSLKDAKVTFTLLYDDDTTPLANWTAFRDSFLNGSNIILAILDGDSATTGTQGLAAAFFVSKFSVKEGLGDAVEADVDLMLTVFATPPEWVTV